MSARHYCLSPATGCAACPGKDSPRGFRRRRPSCPCVACTVNALHAAQAKGDYSRIAAARQDYTDALHRQPAHRS